MRDYSGPKFKGPDVDYLSWLLARRSYKDDSKIYLDTQDLNNAITYKELLALTKHIGRGLREYEGIGSEGRGKDVVMVYSANQVSNSRKHDLLVADVPHCNHKRSLCRWNLQYYGSYFGSQGRGVSVSIGSTKSGHLFGRII